MEGKKRGNNKQGSKIINVESQHAELTCGLLSPALLPDSSRPADPQMLSRLFLF